MDLVRFCSLYLLIIGLTINFSWYFVKNTHGFPRRIVAWATLFFPLAPLLIPFVICFYIYKWAIFLIKIGMGRE
jgi:hypothetical protein